MPADFDAAEANIREQVEALNSLATTKVRRPWASFVACIFVGVCVVAGWGPLSNYMKAGSQQPVRTWQHLRPLQTQAAAEVFGETSTATVSDEDVAEAAEAAALAEAEDESETSASPPLASSTSPAGVADPTCHARLHTDYMGERAPVCTLPRPNPDPG